MVTVLLVTSSFKSTPNNLNMSYYSKKMGRSIRETPYFLTARYLRYLYCVQVRYVQKSL